METARTHARAPHPGGHFHQGHPRGKRGGLMQGFRTLVRRELGSHFLSLTGYVVMATVLLLLGFSFVDVLSKLNGMPVDSPLTEIFYVTLYFWLILLLTTPVITMRTFALEKFTGPYETLMTTPVSDV